MNTAEAEFAREIGALDAVFEFVDDFAAAESLGETPAYALRLVVEELFTNLVKHNRGGAECIRIDLGSSGGELRVRLTDFGVLPVEAPAYDRPDPEIPLGERRLGGLGLSLVRGVTERLGYEHDGDGLRVTATLLLEEDDARHSRDE